MRVFNLGMFEEELLNLRRVDVFSSSDDHVLRSADNANCTVFMHYGDVSVKRAIKND